MPSRPDLSFAELDDYVYKTKMSETSISKTSKDIVEKPKTVRPSAPIIEDWDTDSDNDIVLDLNLIRQNQINAAKQNSLRAAASISTSRPVNTAATKSKVNDALPKTYSYFKAHSPNAVKSSACWIWRPTGNVIDHTSKDSGSYMFKRFDYGNPQYTLQDQGIFDSGCSRHMTGNKSLLTYYQEIDGGFVAFGGSYNPFQPRPSQMCDKKNSVLFTKPKCLVLSPDFKLLDESQVLLKVPRQNNMYSFELKNVVPLGEGKATQSLLPTSIRSINHKTYCLVVTNDYSRFSWVFFLATKDETSEILKTFITGIENQINHKIKIIRCDNGTEFENNDMNQFCGIKEIKREFSVARTPQQNGVAKRNNRTLIEAVRTMLVDSFLPTTSWAEAVSICCYFRIEFLVTKHLQQDTYVTITCETT
ncbi:putative ribonuclease H-like domain-containing protein [Tanacetum coccineum]|uniref:Ribonuclease H-like domain-containing protein n=1 Tax=Tanacetum coccineum TaxID=301880 RepID=A0ABQ5AU33_9ASTR